MTLPLRLFLFIPFGSVIVMAASPLVEPAEFAQAFKFPEQNLRTRDLTDVTRKREPNISTAVLLDSENNTFAPTSILVGKEGLLLSDKLRRRLTHALEEQSNQGGGRPNILKIELPNGVIGFVGTAAFGPGGSEEMAVVNIPSHGVDVQIKISVPYETPLDVTEATRTYHDALTKDGGFVAAALELSMRNVVTHVVQNTPPVAAPTAALPPTPATPPPLARPLASPLPPSSPTPVTGLSDPAEQRKAPVWPWVVGGIVLVIIAAIALRRRT